MRFWSSLWNIYLYSSKHNGQPRGKAGRQVVNCFKMCIFAVASTILLCLDRCLKRLWIASKCVSLQWQAQFSFASLAVCCGCELLQNVYLCSGKHNLSLFGDEGEAVVNCFKMCIFAVASTIVWESRLKGVSCELLQNVYLCSGKHNSLQSLHVPTHVVNCFKMCIFAVASTIFEQWSAPRFSLWIASKCVSLQWQAQ